MGNLLWLDQIGPSSGVPRAPPFLVLEPARRSADLKRKGRTRKTGSEALFIIFVNRLPNSPSPSLLVCLTHRHLRPLPPNSSPPSLPLSNFLSVLFFILSDFVVCWARGASEREDYATQSKWIGTVGRRGRSVGTVGRSARSVGAGGRSARSVGAGARSARSVGAGGRSDGGCTPRACKGQASSARGFLMENEFPKTQFSASMLLRF